MYKIVKYFELIIIICISEFRATIMKVLTMCRGPEKIEISKIIFPALLILHSLQLPNNTHVFIVNITHCTLFYVPPELSSHNMRVRFVHT